MLLPWFPAPALADEPKTGAAAVALLEVNTGKVLYAKDADKKLPMASTTKVMTAILALERCALSEMVTVTKEAYGTEGSSVYLELGEKLSVEDLLYGLMLASGNDAAVALAVHMAGSVEAFADLMNAKAVEIGALNTHFVTPNGLHNDNHYTTAYDLALISAYALKNEGFRTVVGTTYHRTSTGNLQRTFKNKNKLLWQYEGGNGIKTGYTKAAGKCLSFAAQRDGMQLVGVVLNCPDTFNAAMNILNYGFSHYEMKRAVAAGDVIARARVLGGKKNVLELVVNEDIMIPVEKGSNPVLRSRIAIDEGIRAPIRAGDKLGVLELYDEGGEKLLSAWPLVAKHNVEAADFGFYLDKLFGCWAA
ncbi:MAG TPA: D-alanyl-D-alanine carboxypeptidase family protein [Clostridia bacterium]|nr:D-alanyl-D-alanine carboxypeptidase family protein [Clostridia bacterium]